MSSQLEKGFTNMEGERLEDTYFRALELEVLVLIDPKNVYTYIKINTYMHTYINFIVLCTFRN